jgi:hypothetical protein
VAPDASLKLRAEDVDDLAVISACVQDALISVRDLVYDRGARSFTLVVNRFRWEGRPGPDGAAPFERTHAALVFSEVLRVSYRGFRRSEEDRILSLLAIRTSDKPLVDGTRTIDLEFSGGATVRLTVAAIRLRVSDIGEPWPTTWQPDHAEDRP